MTSASTKTVYPINPGSHPLQLTGIIQQVIQAEINGHLTLTSELGQQWTLYFQLGRIVWASGGEHRFRRWHRVLHQVGISPASIQVREKKLPAQWEHWVLTVLLKRNRLKREEVQRAIETNIKEVLFDLLQASAQMIQMACNVTQANIGDSPVTILGTPDDFIGQARESLKAWQKTCLGSYSANFVPVVSSLEALQKQASPQIYVSLVNTLTGKATLRDMAQFRRQSLAELADSLAPLVQQNLLAFGPIADFPPPTPRPQTEPGARSGAPGDRPQPANSRPAIPESPPRAIAPQAQNLIPLVVCIDDSPQVGCILEHVLTPLGYQVLNIQDPIQALSTLMRRKPDFIFLDLIMPLITGYELCSQIRRISILQETPIAILTGNDGIVDRVRAKLSGANDFLSKPVVPEKVLAVLQKHLSHQLGPSFSDSASDRVSDMAA